MTQIQVPKFRNKMHRVEIMAILENVLLGKTEDFEV
jgi:hypothetical protein